MRIRICCIGRGCSHREDQDISLLIGVCGPSASLVELARRAGPCRQCGRRGAYVVPLWELPKRHTGYRAHMELVRKGLLAELKYISLRID